MKRTAASALRSLKGKPDISIGLSVTVSRHKIMTKNPYIKRITINEQKSRHRSSGIHHHEKRNFTRNLPEDL